MFFLKPIQLQRLVSLLSRISYIIPHQFLGLQSSFCDLITRLQTIKYFSVFHLPSFLLTISFNSWINNGTWSGKFKISSLLTVDDACLSSYQNKLSTLPDISSIIDHDLWSFVRPERRDHSSSRPLLIGEFHIRSSTVRWYVPSLYRISAVMFYEFRKISLCTFANSCTSIQKIISLF